MELFQINRYYDNEIEEYKMYYLIKYFIKSIFFLAILLIYRNYENNYSPLKSILRYHYIDYKETNLLPFNRSFLSEYIQINETDNLDYYFNLTYLNFTYSNKFKMVKVEYHVGFYDKNDNIIHPSYAVSHNLHVNCHIVIRDTNKHIDSLANILGDKYFKCIEIFNLDERIKFGIKIYRIKENPNNPDEYIVENYNNVYFFEEIDLKFTTFSYKDDDLFNPFFVSDKYISIVRKMNNFKLNKTMKLFKSYIDYPYTTLKSNAVVEENKWFFRNIYNYFFCMCLGETCVHEKINRQCKFLFYLHIIDKNRDIYEKTEYLLMDFIYKALPDDDVFPIFKEMLKQGLPVHYLTEKIKELNNTNSYLPIIYVDRYNATIDGDFLEKFLPLFLRLKVVATARDGIFLSNLFYNIEYINYVFVGHGVTYFKHFLFNNYRYLLAKQIDKILIPSSNILISLAKKYGFNDEEIIPINLPRWDKYNNNTSDKLLDKQGNIVNNSIFVMFSWREMEKNKNISELFNITILNLINNEKLNEQLENNHINLFFGVHYKTKYIYRGEFKKALKKKKNMKYVDQNDISLCLSNADLLVTDFASVVFDMMYRKKPYVLLIPDANDTKIREIYTSDYAELLESLRNDTFAFENKFFNVDEAVDKIIYYIKRNFKLDSKLKNFYKIFNFKKGNNLNKFIDYLKELK